MLNCAGKWLSIKLLRAVSDPFKSSMPFAKCRAKPSFPRRFKNLPTKIRLYRSRPSKPFLNPYIVAFMVEALGLKGGERVLEIGAGSGYAAAVLSRIAGEVYTVERIGQLAEKAASRLADLGYDNVHVLHGDGTLGWPDHSPYDAIIVAAGGPSVPTKLKQQLKVGGRLVIPVGTDARAQELVRVTRLSETEFTTEDIADVRFVPLIGEEGWLPEEGELASFARPIQRTRKPEADVAQIIASASVPFDAIDDANLAPLLRPHWECESGSYRRSHPWHLGVLPHARAHLAGTHREEGFHLCCH